MEKAIISGLSISKDSGRQCGNECSYSSRNNEYGDWNKKEPDAQVLAFITPLGKFWLRYWLAKICKVFLPGKNTHLRKFAREPSVARRANLKYQTLMSLPDGPKSPKIWQML